MDFILDNVFILIPVALFIGFRVLEAWRKGQEAVSKTNSDAPHFFRDDDEDDEPARPGVYPPVRQTASAGVKRTTPPPPKPVPVVQNPAVSKKAAPAVVPPPQAASPAAFLDSRSLKKAVVMAEILGPPKALQQPGGGRF